MVLIEALSCGLPLVSFDAPCGPKDVIQNGENGFIVETGNRAALSDKINTLIESDSLRLEMGRKARLSSENYQVEKIMNQWINLFHRYE
jgi:glycosyltransferase involved in cell wall biosynthesis